jgi:CubicO group peptidase (beta-lactamase class C family)
MFSEDLIADQPEDVGVDAERLEDVFARAKREVDDGLIDSATVAVGRQGKIAGWRTFGAAQQGGDVKTATDETLYCIFSSTKAVVAAAVWLLLCEDELLRLDERVADIIPEFGTNGKDVVTVEQVLLHTAGFPLAPMAPERWGDRKKRLEAFSQWRLTFQPGSQYFYHATSAHWVLAEIIERRTGNDWRSFVRERITKPMGLEELFIGLPAEHDDRVARVNHRGERIEPPGGYGEVTPEAVERMSDPSRLRNGAPGAGGVASAAELAMFYQVLVNGGRTVVGTQVLQPETIRFGTTVRSGGLCDRINGTPVNRGLSIVVSGGDGNAYMRGFGRVLGPRAFGHGGAGGQIAWGDPDTGISLGYCTNTFRDWITIGRRGTALSSLAAQCATD